MYRLIKKTCDFAPTESQLMNTLTHYLDILEAQNKLVYIRNNSGALKTDFRFIRFGKKGSSDLLIFLKGGKVLFVEVKTEKGKQSLSQKEFEKNVKNLGFDYFIVRNIEELERSLKHGQV